MITHENILAISRRASAKVLEGLVANQDLLKEAGIVSGNRLNMFLAQIAHESDGFKTTREYASGAAYEGREDLGNVYDGDGRRFRGRGLIQLTGRANYEKFNESLSSNLDILEYPELVEEFPLALTASIWFWTTRKLNEVADTGDFKRITKRINGGYNGLADRERYLEIVEGLEL